MTKKEKKELTIEQERLKLLRLYAKNKGIVSRNKPRYEAITPKKIAEYPEYAEKKTEYKKLYRDAEKKLIPVVKRLKEIEAIMVQVKQLQSEGKDTSHLGVKPKKPKGRPKKEKKEGEIEYKTTITKGEPLKKEDFTAEEFKLNFKLNGLIGKLTKQNKQIDDAIKKANEEGRQVHGIDEEEYDKVKKEIIKITKERDDLNNIVRKRVGKQDIITKVQIGGPVVEKKPRGRPRKEKPAKKPRGRPRKEKPVKGPKGRPFKENTKKEIIKEVVKNNLKSIVDDVIQNLPKQENKENTKKSIIKKDNIEIINTNNTIDEPKKKKVNKLDVSKKSKKIKENTKEIIKDVVNKKLKSIVDDVIVKLPTKQKKLIKNDNIEVINTIDEPKKIIKKPDDIKIIKKEPDDITIFKSLPTLRLVLSMITLRLELPNPTRPAFQKMRIKELDEYIKKHNLRYDLIINEYNKILYRISGRETPEKILARDKRMKRYGIK